PADHRRQGRSRSVVESGVAVRRPLLSTRSSAAAVAGYCPCSGQCGEVLVGENPAARLNIGPYLFGGGGARDDGCDTALGRQPRHGQFQQGVVTFLREGL